MHQTTKNELARRAEALARYESSQAGPPGPWAAVLGLFLWTAAVVWMTVWVVAP